MADAPFPPATHYDQVARYLLTRTRGNFFQWLLKMTPAQVRWDSWLPTQLTFPGIQQRICDGVAELTHLADNGRPFAALMEIQARPDTLITGRLMVAGGLYWMIVKPNDLTGDRFELVGIVINLTGVGNSARQSKISTAEWTLKPIEVNFETLDAGEILGLIAQGAVPWELLAFIPLMKRGDESAIIADWKKLVLTRLDPNERGDCGLARVFAELVGRENLWRDAMNEIGFIESPMISRIVAEAVTRAEAQAEARGKTAGKTEGKIEEKVEKVLHVLRRLGTLPESLVKTVASCTDADRLDGWFDVALGSTTLEQFRQKAGL